MVNVDSFCCAIQIVFFILSRFWGLGPSSGCRLIKRYERLKLVHGAVCGNRLCGKKGKTLCIFVFLKALLNYDSFNHNSTVPILFKVLHGYDCFMIVPRLLPNFNHGN